MAGRGMTGIRAYAVAALVLTLVLFFSASSHAADPGQERTTISADTIEQHGEVFHGEGSVVVEAPGRDRRGWKLFGEDDLNKIQAEVNRTHKRRRISLRST